MNINFIVRLKDFTYGKFTSWVFTRIQFQRWCAGVTLSRSAFMPLKKASSFFLLSNESLSESNCPWYVWFWSKNCLLSVFTFWYSYTNMPQVSVNTANIPKNKPLLTVFLFVVSITIHFWWSRWKVHKRCFFWFMILKRKPCNFIA